MESTQFRNHWLHSVESGVDLLLQERRWKIKSQAEYEIHERMVPSWRRDKDNHFQNFVVGEKIIPFSPAHDGNDRKKCAYNEQRHSRCQENIQMLKALESIFREFWSL